MKITSHLCFSNWLKNSIVILLLLGCSPTGAENNAKLNELLAKNHISLSAKKEIVVIVPMDYSCTSCINVLFKEIYANKSRIIHDRFHLILSGFSSKIIRLKTPKPIIESPFTSIEKTNFAQTFKLVNRQPKAFVIIDNNQTNTYEFDASNVNNIFSKILNQDN